jgi:DNA alkylation repair enzyme
VAEGGDEFIGVRMGQVFALAKEFIELPPAELERLLESPIHEVRAGALSIMDKQARRRRTSEARRKELFELYLRRIDRVDNWDLVDLAAPYVVGGYLSDKPRDVLYELARSENPWKRRTAIVSTGFFIRQGEVDDTFRIAELLAADDHELVQKAPAGCSARPGSGIASGSWGSWTTSPPACRGSCCATRSSTSISNSARTISAGGRRRPARDCLSWRSRFPDSGTGCPPDGR